MMHIREKIREILLNETIQQTMTLLEDRYEIPRLILVKPNIKIASLNNRFLETILYFNRNRMNRQFLCLFLDLRKLPVPHQVSHVL